MIGHRSAMRGNEFRPPLPPGRLSKGREGIGGKGLHATVAAAMSDGRVRHLRANTTRAEEFG